jgi:hypothetical protein
MATNNDKIIYGGNMMLFVSSGATLYPMAFSTTAKLSISLSTRTIASKDDGDWENTCGGKFTWNASTETLMNFASTGTTHDTNDVYAMFVNKVPINFAFAQKCGTSPSWGVCTSARRYVGCALITNMEMDATDNENGKASIQLNGTSQLCSVTS